MSLHEARSAARLAELIGSRICHDLISPLGAIANGLELMEMAGASAGPELRLVEESARNATLRIRLFRLAFGAAHEGQMVSRGELAALAAGLSGEGRIAVELELPDQCPRAEAKLAVLALLCAERALPRGGALRACRDTAGGWTVEARAEQLRVEPDLWARLIDRDTALDETAPLEASAVQFALLRLTAGALGRQPTLDRREQLLRLRF